PSFQLGTGGTYYLFAKLDNTGGVNETDETNNVAQAPSTLSVTTTTPFIVDNSDQGYSESGPGGFNTGGGVYKGSARAHPKGSGSNAATWVIAGLASGSYAVQADWKGYSDQAPNATFQIYDGNSTTPLATVSVDQTKDASGVLVNGVPFQTLATINVTS